MSLRLYSTCLIDTSLCISPRPKWHVSPAPSRRDPIPVIHRADHPDLAARAILGGAASEAPPGHLQSNLEIEDDPSTPAQAASSTSGSSSSSSNGKGRQLPEDLQRQHQQQQQNLSGSAGRLPFQLKIGHSNPDDADLVLSIAVPVFSDTFRHTCSAEDMTLYLNSHFTLEHIMAELNNPNKRFLLALKPDNTCAGFAQLTIGSTEPCVDHLPQKVELQRIYVAADQHGSGLARLLMDAAFSVAQSEGYRNIWLGVMQGNTRAEKFYEKYGFERVGEHEFYLGSDRQVDDILVRAI